MNGEETQGNISHLTGMMGFIHRSGALAPFQVMMIITGTIFALAAYRQETAFEQPLCFWVLCLLAIEVVMALIIGLILACRRPDCADPDAALRPAPDDGRTETASRRRRRHHTQRRALPNVCPSAQAPGGAREYEILDVRYE